MNKNEYFKYLLIATKDSSRYLKILINLVFSLLVFFLLARTRFIPSGIDKGTIGFVNKKIFLLKDKKIDNYKYITEPIVYEKLKNKLSKTKNTLSQIKKENNIVILIIAESLGKLKDIEIFENLELNIKHSLNKSIENSLNNSYKLISMQKTLSLGGTLSAELNYLCSIQYKDHFNILYNSKNLKKDNFSKCIPNLYMKSDYKTFYIHTAGLDLYARRNIMPILGFNKVFSPSEDKTKFEPLKNFYRCVTKIYCAKSDEFTFEYVKDYINENNKENLFITILTVDLHGPYRSYSLKKQNELEIYKKKALDSIEIISRFVEDVLKNHSESNISILLTSDHPPRFTSLSENLTQKSKRYNFSLIIEPINGL